MYPAFHTREVLLTTAETLGELCLGQPCLFARDPKGAAEFQPQALRYVCGTPARAVVHSAISTSENRLRLSRFW